MTIRTNKLIHGVFGGTLVLLLLTGCTVYSRHFCPSYVVCYQGLSDIKLRPLEEFPNSMAILSGDNRLVQYALTFTGERKEKYDMLCKKHHDLGYNQYRNFPDNLPSESVTYTDQDFVSVEVFSDLDYDERHPAGANLADVVRFMSWSPYKYILSKYKDNYDYDPSAHSESFNTIIPVYFHMNKSSCHPIDKMVCELAPDDLILLGQDGPGLLGILVFEQPPASEGVHRITVKMTSDEGKVFEDTLQLTLK